MFNNYEYIYILCGCPSWFFHGCPVLQICHIVAPTCLFFSHKYSVWTWLCFSPLFSLSTVFMWSFCLLHFFSCFTLLLFIFSFTAGCGSCSSFIQVFIPSKRCSWDLHSSGILCGITECWVPIILRLCSGPIFWGWMHPWSICGWVSSHTHPLHFIDSPVLSFFNGVSDPWRGGHWVLGNQHPVTEQYLRRTKMSNLSLSCTSLYFLFTSEMISLIPYLHVLLWILIGTYGSTTYNWFIICSLPLNLPVHKQQLYLLKIMNN